MHPHVHDLPSSIFESVPRGTLRSLRLEINSLRGSAPPKLVAAKVRPEAFHVKHQLLGPSTLPFALGCSRRVPLLNLPKAARTMMLGVPPGTLPSNPKGERTLLAPFENRPPTQVPRMFHVEYWKHADRIGLALEVIRWISVDFQTANNRSRLLHHAGNAALRTAQMFRVEHASGSIPFTGARPGKTRDSPFASCFAEMALCSTWNIRAC